MALPSKHTAASIGQLIRNTRKQMGLTQQDLALTSGTGLRFITELENGKPTCQLEKVLTVMQTLGLKLHIESPIPLEHSSPETENSGS